MPQSGRVLMDPLCSPKDTIYAHTLQTWDCTNYDKFHGWFSEWPDSTVVVPHWEASEELYNVWVQACLNRVSVMKTRIALTSVDSFWDTNIRFFFSQHQVAKTKQTTAVAGRKTRVKSAYNFDQIFLENLNLLFRHFWKIVMLWLIRQLPWKCIPS